MNLKNGWFEDEKNFRQWLISKLRTQRWHAQAIEDAVSTGLPDVNAGGMGIELWAELKLSRHIHQPGDKLRLEHKLTGPQYMWLMDRQQRGTARCIVAIAWKSSYQSHISLVPVLQWKEFREMDMREMSLCPYTASLSYFEAGGSISVFLKKSITTHRLTH